MKQSKNYKIGSSVIPSDEYELRLTFGDLDVSPLIINGEVWVGNKKNLKAGTKVKDLCPVIPGYYLNPIAINSILMDRNRVINFEPTDVNEGFIPVTAWTGKNTFSVEGNSVFSGGGAAAGFTNLSIGDGEVGSIKTLCSTGYMLALYRDSDYFPAGSQITYGILVEGGNVIARSVYDVTANYIPHAISEPTVVEMELTLTEINWYYGGSRIKWFSMPRVNLGYRLYISVDLGATGKFEDILQKGHS